MRTGQKMNVHTAELEKMIMIMCSDKEREEKKKHIARDDISRESYRCLEKKKKIFPFLFGSTSENNADHFIRKLSSMYCQNFDHLSFTCYITDLTR
jgi:hypothetical protein